MKVPKFTGKTTRDLQSANPEAKAAAATAAAAPAAPAAPAAAAGAVPPAHASRNAGRGRAAAHPRRAATAKPATSTSTSSTRNVTNDRPRRRNAPSVQAAAAPRNTTNNTSSGRQRRPNATSSGRHSPPPVPRSARQPRPVQPNSITEPVSSSPPSSSTTSMDLPTLIRNKLWTEVCERIETYPLEAQRCHYLSLDGVESDNDDGDGANGKGSALSRVLPLHLLVTLQPPSSVLQAVIDANSSAASAKESIGGKLPLHLACLYGASLNCLKALIFVYRDGARTLDSCGKLPLHYICESGPVDKVSLILKTAPTGVFIKDKDGMNALSLARKRQNPDLEAITAAMRRYRLRTLNVKPHTARINKSANLSKGSDEKTTLEVALRRCDVTVPSNNDMIISDEVLIPESKKLGKETVHESISKKSGISGLENDIVHYVVALDEGSIEPGEEEELEMDSLLAKLDSDRSLLSMNQKAIDQIDKQIADSNDALAALQSSRDELEQSAASKQLVLENSRRKITAKKKMILDLMKEIEIEEKAATNTARQLQDARSELEECQGILSEEEAKVSMLERNRDNLIGTYQELSNRTLERDIRLEELLSRQLPDKLK